MDHDEVSSRVKLVDLRVLSDNHYTLHKATFDYRRNDGAWQTMSRESYGIGRSVAVLPYDAARNRVLLLRQFRWPAFQTGHRELLIEAPAGLLDGDTPEEGARREALEEAGVTLSALEPVSECYLSPGAVTERMSLYLGTYDSTVPRAGGGGQFHEGEDIESFEVSLEQAMEMVKTGQVIDAKTIVLIQAARLKAAGL